MSALPSERPSLVILRSHQHTGSLWLSELLSARRYAAFFEFKHLCHKHSGRENLTLADVLRTGCSCLAGDPCGNALSPPHCLKEEMCAGRCTRASDAACRGVAVITSVGLDITAALAAMSPSPTT